MSLVDASVVPPALAHPYILESGVRLSESMLWDVQRAFYRQNGIESWTRGRVPQSITTSPTMAATYSNIVLGFLRDVVDAADLSEPLYIVELGAGSGQFAYRFLKSLQSLLEEACVSHPRCVYVMTDSSDAIVEHWRTTPRLKQFVESGMLDFASFDLLAPGPLTLQISGDVLGPSKLANPVVVIANYVFDSVPQDCFTITGGQLFASLVTVRSSTPDLDLSALQSLVALSIGFDLDPVNPAHAYGDASVNSILEHYTDSLGETMFLLPTTALACVRYIQELSANRGLILIADLGQTTPDELQGSGPPNFGAEGGFWLPVNFHALGEYVRATGGRPHHPLSRAQHLNISMLELGVPTEARTEVMAAYRRALEHVGPDDRFALTRTVADHLPTLGAEQLIALLNACGWDPELLEECTPRLVEVLQSAPADTCRALRRGVKLAWEQYYPMAGRGDLPFCCGVLLYTLDDFRDAIQYFERSLEEVGDDPRTTFNIALALYRLRELPEALAWLDRTLALDPTGEPARTMRVHVQSDLASQS